MKTSEEIKNGLELCGKGIGCRGYCPYDSFEESLEECTGKLAMDAFSLIEQLERERDAAVSELKGYGCASCKYLMFPPTDTCGKKCVDFCNWEWRGVKEEKDENT